MTDTVPATMISAMSAAQAKSAIYQELFRAWEGGQLSHESLDTLPLLAETAVAALVSACQDDDLDLAEGPLDVISDALVTPLANAYRDGVRPSADELAVEVYEALIDANHLPGVNAKRHCTDSLDSQESAV